MSNFVNLAHYGIGGGDAFNGFGVSSPEQLANLEKALSADYQVSGQTGGSALRVESLEGSLKVTTFTARHIKMWKKIFKSPAYSTVEEFNQVTSYGGTGFAFTKEGELPPAQDSSYIRQTAKVKYLGTTREVTHPMTVVHPAHGDVIAQQNHEGILWVLQNVEDAIFHGDSTLAFSGQAEQWDGLDALIDSTSVIDLQANPITEADIEEGTNQLIEQFAYPSDIWHSPRVGSDLVKQFYPRERIQLPAPVNGQVGLSVNSIMTQAGVIEMNPDVFLKRGPTPPASATSTNAPATPASVSASTGSGTNGNFNKNASSGTNNYAYVVTAANRFGESAPVFQGGTGIDITQGQKDAGNRIALTITNAGSLGSFPVEFFRVYRTVAQASGATAPSSVASYSLILQVPTSSQTGSGTTTVNDVNFILPFTETVYLGQMAPEVITMRQLLPMMRLDLAVLAPSYRWMILLYAVPVLFAPKKWLKFINCGRLT